ncbi:PREDICTED: uncharacterized protein LOC109237041 [Nicotiana attenuata]|uniref:Uncharacterized protein n=1 Tax=Nicotiana attenuata TaxID=49451 RepID=A0A314LFB5_NICAT|nr:PREDICTED: uncharacterized protein LOC109237041 [Nicotiana attenuata]OIT40243.1 hypothetical protein A4A49_13386 [Nicotiana attenuata]
MSVSMIMKKREVEGSSGFMHALSSVCVDPNEKYVCGNNKNMFFYEEKINEEKSLNSCSSSSSIGKNSDISEGSMEKTDDSEEVQSSYKSPLNSMETLEEVLPMRKGISRFYNGKSKSFTSLREASTKDLAKPENAYIRKRRNLLACGLAWDTNKNRGGISKRVTNSSRTTLALAAAMNCCSSSSSGLSSISENTTNSSSTSSVPFVSRLNPHFKEYNNHNHSNGLNSPCLSPLARGNFSGWRSFSLADLQQCEFVSVTRSPTLEAAATAAGGSNAKVENELT